MVIRKILEKFGLEFTRDMIEFVQTASSKYISGRGAICPACNESRVKVSKTAGEGIRYHTCHRCGLTFKSIEKRVSL